MDMEIDSPAAPSSQGSQAKKESVNGIMASPETQGSVTVAIHPLVLLNISEHWTRAKAQADGLSQKVFGVILGKQSGRHLELMNSFEVVVTVVENQPVLDTNFYHIRTEQYKEVFSDLECLGWYTNGEKPTAEDLCIQRQMCEFNESPVLVKLHTESKSRDKLPVFMYESVIDMIAGEAKMLFIELPYTLATEEAERIGIDHIARTSKTSSAGQCAAVTEHLTGQTGAIRMLFTRVQLIREYLLSVQNGSLPRDESVLREIKSLCCRLPVAGGPVFNKEFLNQCNDVCLITLLGALTKSCNVLNQLVNKLNLMQERGSTVTSKRMKGMMF